MILLVAYLILINLISYSLFGHDKTCARKDRWRIPEATLLFIALAGGSVGAYLGMKRFHHKTKKAVFSVGIPVIFAVQVIFASLYILHY